MGEFRLDSTLGCQISSDPQSSFQPDSTAKFGVETAETKPEIVCVHTSSGHTFAFGNTIAHEQSCSKMFTNYVIVLKQYSAHCLSKSRSKIIVLKDR